MPFLTSLRFTFLSANEADWPADAACTFILFRSIERTAVGMNWPSESGPTKTLSPSCMMPALTIPETTVPTNGTEKVSLTENSKGASEL